MIMWLTLIWGGSEQSFLTRPRCHKPGVGCCVWLRVWCETAAYKCHRAWCHETRHRSPSPSPAHTERQTHNLKKPFIKHKYRIKLLFRDAFTLEIHLAGTNEASPESSQDLHHHGTAVAPDRVERPHPLHLSPPANLLPHDHAKINNKKRTPLCLKIQSTPSSHTWRTNVTPQNIPGILTRVWSWMRLSITSLRAVVSFSSSTEWCTSSRIPFILIQKLTVIKQITWRWEASELLGPSDIYWKHNRENSRKYWLKIEESLEKLHILRTGEDLNFWVNC